MEDTPGMRRLIFVLTLVAIGSAGCRHFDMADPGGLWPFHKEARTDKVPGLATPAERTAVLKGLAEKAPQSSKDEQERVSRELAQAIRREEDPSLRVEIVRTLGQYPTESASMTLRSALNDPEAEVRAAACEAWGRRGGPEAIEVLGGVASGDVDQDVRLAAIQSLGNTRDPKASAALGAVLTDSDPALQRRTMLSLRDVTGKDFGEDARKWRQYLDGNTPEEDRSLWIVERARTAWGLF